MSLVFSGCSRRTEPKEGAPGAPVPTSGAPTAAEWARSAPIPSSPEVLELGRATYQKQCVACHGPDGRGEGEAAYLLYPKPRDFTKANYRLVSTWEGVATDEDLFQTISRGMPGSAMPPWAHLPERTRWALVHYIKTFATRPLTIGEPHEPGEPGGPSGVIRTGKAPVHDEESIRLGREAFVKGCAPCHGAAGRGDGSQEQWDDAGRPTRPRDLTAGIFKGNPTPENVYRRIVAGLPGTPMPMSDYLHGETAWHLTNYVLSLSSEEERRRVEQRQIAIEARATDRLPAHPDDGAWSDAPPAELSLMPLWWRTNRPSHVTVRALHDQKEIAFLLVWSDATHDHTAIRPQDFRDAAAVEFSLTDDPPFFAMGEKGAFVNIWMWKSEKQADLEPAFQDIEKAYPNIGIDSYPNLRRSPLEQPARNALTLESDPTFVTGWGAGNIVSDPTHTRSAEDLAAQGFGTVRARPPIDRTVEATGVYAEGTYRVVFRRSLRSSGPNAVALRPGSTVPVAFAVWDGSAGDRDGKKSVTIWQELTVAERRLAWAR
jgi:mono/diheme cytochrome c family protein